MTYQLRSNFCVTKEQLDNYLFLGGLIDTRVMYTYLDVQDISSVDGLVLTNNEYEAR